MEEMVSPGATDRATANGRASLSGYGKLKPSSGTNSSPGIDGPDNVEARPSDKKQNVQEVALRRELVSVRNVNEAIEGVIASLQKAKNSLGVGGSAKDPGNANRDVAGCQSDRQLRFYASQYMDTDIVSN